MVPFQEGNKPRVLSIQLLSVKCHRGECLITAAHTQSPGRK